MGILDSRKLILLCLMAAGPFTSSCGMLNQGGEGSASNDGNSSQTATVTYVSNSINFVSYNMSNGYTYATSGVPSVTGGTLTNCTIAYSRGPTPYIPPSIDPSTCEVSDFRDSGTNFCGGAHGPGSGTYYLVTPIINGEAGTPVELLLYCSADDTSPC